MINFLDVYIDIYNKTGVKYNSFNNKKLSGKLNDITKLKQSHLNKINLLAK